MFKCEFMRIYILLLITYLCVIVPHSSLYGQSGVVLSGASNGEEVNISYSIGQAVTGYASDSNSSINIGVQQVFESIISTSVNQPTTDISLSVSPNPFVDNIDVYVSNPNSTYSILIFDTKGSLLFSTPLTGSPMSVNLSSIPTGVYYLALVDKELRLIQSVKIVKNI